MKRRPVALTLLALLVFGIAISFPVQIMIRFGIPPTELAAIADKLAPLNWFTMIIGLVFAGLVFRASAMARILAPVFLILIAWNNWLVASMDDYVSSDIILLGTAIVFMATMSLLHPEIRRLFSNPALRWWLTPPRKQIAIPARIRPTQGGSEILAHTFDLSEEGVFIRVENWAASPVRSLSVGSHCAVSLDLEPDRTVHGIARVVRRADAAGRYPAGFAVFFEGFESDDRSRLKKFVRALPAATG